MATNGKITLDDIKRDESRWVLDSVDKIVFWIEYQLEEQEKASLKNNMPPFKCINLSKCIIYTDTTQDGKPTMTNLYLLAGKINCIKDKTNQESPFHQEVLLPFICDHSIIYAPYFHQTKFHDYFSLSHTQIHGGGSFGSCTFEGDFYAQETDFGQCGDFLFTEFKKDVNFFGAKFSAPNIDFSRSIFHGNASFNSIVIKEQEGYRNTIITFYQSVFHRNFKMENTSLQRACTFEQGQFHGDISLNKTSSTSVITFSGASVFKRLLISIEDENEKCELNELYFDNSRLYDRIDIEGYSIASLSACFAHINGLCIFRLYHCKIDNLDMNSIYNSGFIYFSRNNIAKISLEDAIGRGVIEVNQNNNPEIAGIADRRTARLLKDSAIKGNNAIDAVKFKRIEAEKYLKEGIECHEKILFYLNRYSNKHGTSWLRALWVTLLITLLFCILILCFGETATSSQNILEVSCNHFIKTYFGLLDITNFGGNLQGMHFNGFGYALFYLAKILIAYGYYQFISAFRKYGR